MKRKSDAALQSPAQQCASEQQNPPKRRAVSRASSTASQSSPAPAVVADARQGTGPQARARDVSEPRMVVESSGSSDMLPAGSVFPIQIGAALFRLSGASLCSDAPSYFSHFFSEQLRNSSGRARDVRTLYIDRDPETFRDIALHLQGYHMVPRDGEHFVKLFADAQFYSLPRLTSQLFKSDIFISIGGAPFRIPRSLFSAPGDSPNFFSLGFAQWFSVPSDAFPGLDRQALLRPPSISPPAVPSRSAETFAELLRMLQGYEVEIRGDVHRRMLLRDARYFHLKGLEQRLLPCDISTNLRRGTTEVLLRLEDVRQSGVGFALDAAETEQPATEETAQARPAGYVTYARPYTDDAHTPHALVLETPSESATLRIPALADPHLLEAAATFHAATHRRMTALFGVVATKLGLASPSLQNTPASPVRVRIDGACDLTLDGAYVDLGATRVRDDADWIVGRAQWRVRVESASASASVDAGEAEPRIVLWGVKIEAFTRERARNASRAFLG